MKIKDQIPVDDECLKLIEKYEMLPNIIDHSLKVRDVSLAIVNNLKDNNIINKELVVAAALLHDIAKTMTLKDNSMMHDILGGKILRELNFNSIAEIVESHIFLDNFDPHGKLEEKEIVYYADKRVMHDKVVTVDDRINDLVERYGMTDKHKVLILLNRNTILHIEKKIQSFMKKNIDEVISEL